MQPLREDCGRGVAWEGGKKVRCLHEGQKKVQGLRPRTEIPLRRETASRRRSGESNKEEKREIERKKNANRATEGKGGSRAWRGRGEGGIN